MSEAARADGLAIVAIGCRFPGGAGTPDQFWTLLCDGIDAITEVPPDRFDLADVYDADPARPGTLYTRWGGFLADVQAFDAGFFGISPREASRMDPQQRLLLEVVWEALEDGGLPADRLAGSRTGVFIGVSTHDYHDLVVNPGSRHLLDAHSSTGTALSIAANRISYAYDLHGPSLSVDTACSSSLTAVHLACRSLRHGECDLAIAGGVNAFLTPEIAIGFCRASMLSPDGRCKAFDARANGFVRGEGAGVVVLKPLGRALADRDHIYAVLRGSAVNQDGRTVGITVPSADAQEALIRAALRDAGLPPAAVQYVEAHGTGTPVGDPIEASALGRVFGGDRGPSEPLLIGSVKTNIGHLEAAAGIAGLIKTALALERRMIPPTLHFQSPAPAIPLGELRLRVAAELSPWAAVEGARAAAGVNAFGFGGANAHVVLEAPPARPPAGPADDRDVAHILPLSARHPHALRELAARYRDLLAGDRCPALADICYSAAVRRSHHAHRAALVGTTRAELVEQLDATAAAPGRLARHREPRVAFVFTGMGPQWWGMARRLLADEPVFRAVIEDHDRRFRAIGTWPLLPALLAGPEVSRVHEADQAPVANLAIQMGLVALWRSWGIAPDAIVGHSAGEIAAACAAGALGPDDALAVAFHRGRLQHRTSGSGTMLSAGMSAAEIAPVIAPVAGRVSLAAINSPTSVTLSGERQALEAVAAEVARRQRFHRFLAVDVPYHGPGMDALRGEFAQALAGLSPRAPVTRLVSTVSGGWADAPPDATYWVANLREPVRFAEAIDRLGDAGCELFVEIGPHPVLATSISECLAARGRSGTALPSLRRHDDDRRVLLRSLAALYEAGRRVEWSGVYRGGALVPLPRYPWQRERHWIELPAPASHRPPGAATGHPLLGNRLRSPRPCWEVALGQPRLAYLDDHVVQGTAVLPAAAYAEMALAAAGSPDAGASVEGLAFRRMLGLGDRARMLLQLVQDGPAFEIHAAATAADAAWTLHAVGTIGAMPRGGARAVDLAAVRARCAAQVPAAEVYAALEARGLCYRGVFRGIDALWRGRGEALARVALPEDGRAEAERYHVHPALLDAAFQAMLMAAEPAGGADSRPRALYLPRSIARLTLRRRPGVAGWSHATVRGLDGEAITGDIAILDDDGEVAVEIEGLRCTALPEPERAKGGGTDEPTYQLRWEPQPRGSGSGAGPTPVRPAGELIARLRPLAERLAVEQGWAERLDRAEPIFAAMAAHLARGALLALGWNPGDSRALDADALAGPLGIAPRHHRFLHRLLEILREAPALEPSDGSAAAERALAARLAEQALAEFPENGAAVDLLRRAGEHLDAVLTDRLDAREVLFAADAGRAWARLFVELPSYAYYNALAAEAVAAAVEAVPEDARVRVLEIGAGTGGTTLSVLPRLAGRNAEYHFTDVSALFLAQARERFRHVPAVQVASLDIEADPIAQLGSEPFDVVLAANVLHATADLRTSLRHIARLLAPGGLLVLVEGLRKVPSVDLTVGITDGWWRFRDVDVRPAHPLVDGRRWQALLAEAGFEGAGVVAEPVAAGASPLQAVVLATRPVAAPRAVAGPGGRTWLVHVDGGAVGPAIVASLRARGDRCVTVARGAAYVRHDADRYVLGPDGDEGAARLAGDLAAAGCDPDGVIHAWSLDAPAGNALSATGAVAFARDTCRSVVALLRAFEVHGRRRPPLWLITAGAQAVRDEADGPAVAQAPIWGFVRVLASEQPAARCRLVDLGPDPGTEEVRALLDEIDAAGAEEEVALRGPLRFVPRLRRAPLRGAIQAAQKRQRAPDRHPFRLELDTPGALESLALRDVPAARPGPGEILIRVLAAGLNFRDVMLALGLLPPVAAPGHTGQVMLGFECAGIVVECGDGVVEFRPGDEVMAIAVGCLASHVITRADLAARKPARLTMEQAAGVPLVFATAHYALEHLARLCAGERVLVHAGAGGVGLAAIQIARRIGAEVLATAGSEDKRAYLRALGVAHVMDSRSLAFADEVMALTGGAGVDVVLNSLAGEAIARGLSILRPYGRFVELGKRDLHADTAVGLRPFLRNLSFFSVALDQMCLDRPALLGSILRQIAARVDGGMLEPVPHTALDLAEAESALRSLGQARHIGKVVLTVQGPAYRTAPDTERPICRPDATYVVTGGLGGFGLTVARWMVERGARHVVLMSRRGRPLAENRAAFAALTASPADIAVFRGDASREDDVRRLLEEIRAARPPLRGVVHAAMVLDDGLAQHMSPERLQAVLEPKIAGAWHLHALTAAEDLDFFVMFSSWASVLGTAGQSNYAAANSFLEALAPYRRSRGLPALTVAWGGLAETGYLARHAPIADQLRRHGLDLMPAAEAVGWLEEALRLGFAQVMVGRVDWRRLAAVETGLEVVRRSRRLAGLLPAVAGERAEAPGAGTVELASLLARAAPHERRGLLEQQLVARVARVLGMSPGTVDPARPLTEMGVDSLMAVQIRNGIEADLGIGVPVVTLLQGPSVAELAAAVLDRLGTATPAAGTALDEADPEVVGRLLAEIEGVSDDEVRALLAAERRRAGEEPDE